MPEEAVKTTLNASSSLSSWVQELSIILTGFRSRGSAVESDRAGAVDQPHNICSVLRVVRLLNYLHLLYRDT